jgi:hypothetical protein
MNTFDSYTKLAQRALNYTSYAKTNGTLGIIQNDFYEDEPHPVLREVLQYHVTKDRDQLRKEVARSIKQHKITDSLEQKILYFGSLAMSNETIKEGTGNPYQSLQKIYNALHLPYSTEIADSFAESYPELELILDDLESS